MRDGEELSMTRRIRSARTCNAKGRVLRTTYDGVNSLRSATLPLLPPACCVQLLLACVHKVLEVTFLPVSGSSSALRHRALRADSDVNGMCAMVAQGNLR